MKRLIVIGKCGFECYGGLGEVVGRWRRTHPRAGRASPAVLCVFLASTKGSSEVMGPDSGRRRALRCICSYIDSHRDPSRHDPTKRQASSRIRSRC